MKKTFLCDMDDTSVDLNNPWREQHAIRTGIHFNREDWKTWDLVKNFGEENAKALFETTRVIPHFYRDLPPMDGVVEGLRALYDAGFDIVFLTASPKWGFEDKTTWVEQHVPFVDPVTNIIHGHRKDLVLGDYLVDDGPHNLLSSPAKHKIVFDAPWNRNLTQFHRVFNWKEVVDYVLQREEMAG